MSQQSFLGRYPSEYHIEAIEPTVVVSIKYEHLEELYKKSKKMEHLGRLVVTYIMVISDSWQDIFEAPVALVPGSSSQNLKNVHGESF